MFYGGGWITSVDAFSGGLIADCGEYLGPWPPVSVLEQNLPADAREIDYLIALPPPSGNVDDAANGSYSTVYFQEWGYRDSDGDFATGDSGISQAGSAVGEERPEGAHLYVGWFAPSELGQPSLPAQSIVPQDWTIGGRGWTRGPGHWSDWQPGYEFSVSAQPRMHLFNELYRQSNDFYRYSLGQWPDIDANIRGMVDDVETGSGSTLRWDGSDSVPNFIGSEPPLVSGRWDLAGSGFRMMASDYNQPYGGYPGPYTQVWSQYVALNFDAADSFDQVPPFLPDLPLDSEAIPPGELSGRTIDGLIQFGSDASAFGAWQDAGYPGKLSYETDDIGSNPTRTDFPDEPVLTPAYFDPPTDLPLFIGITDPLTPLSANAGIDLDGVPLHVAPQLVASDLEPLTTARFDINTPTPTHPATAPYGRDYSPGYDGNAFFKTVDFLASIPFSEVSRTAFAVVAMCGYFNDEDLPFAATDSHPFDMLAWFGSGAAIIGTLPIASFFTDKTITLNLTSPSWRYWQLGLIPAIELPPPSSVPQARDVAWM